MEKQNSKSTTLWIVVVIVIIVLIGILIYYNSGNSTTPLSQPATVSQTSGQTQSGGLMIPYYTIAATTSPTVGTYLIAANHMTLYVYGKDTAGTSTCSGLCATQWSPYIVGSTTPLTESPTITGNIGSISRDDGTVEITYNDLPLYFYVNDVNPGDVNGNNVSDFAVAKP